MDLRKHKFLRECSAPTSLQQENIGRGRAFASLSHNSLLQSSFANALPSLLLNIIHDCGLEIFGECTRFRAEHSRSKRICKIINFCGNALPLHLISLIVKSSEKFVMANCYDPKVVCQKFSENGSGDGEKAGDR